MTRPLDPPGTPVPAPPRPTAAAERHPCGAAIGRCALVALNAFGGVLGCAVLIACSEPAARELPPAPHGWLDSARFYLVETAGARMGGAAARSLRPGFGLMVVEELMLGAERMGRTPAGGLVALRDLRPVQPSAFRGADIAHAQLDFAFTGTEATHLWRSPDRRGRPLATLQPHTRIGLHSARAPAGWQAVHGGFAQLSTLHIPRRSPRPIAVGSAERWLDVELASQTLVAYEGDAPRFATLVSTGIGRPGSAFETPRGAHRIESKWLSATMDNLEHSGVTPYSYADVPYTQYIGRIALHGTFWHDRFGTPVSHGCINVSLHDARWLFQFTNPQLPAGETQIAATRNKRGTLIRVR